MTVEAEKCPICGGKAIIRQAKHDQIVDTLHTGRFKVDCIGKAKNKCRYKGTAYYLTKDEAIISWNLWAREVNSGV